MYPPRPTWKVGTPWTSGALPPAPDTNPVSISRSCSCFARCRWRALAYRLCFITSSDPSRAGADPLWALAGEMIRGEDCVRGRVWSGLLSTLLSNHRNGSKIRNRSFRLRGCTVAFKAWSGRPDSNRRHPAWKAFPPQRCAAKLDRVPKSVQLSCLQNDDYFTFLEIRKPMEQV